MTQSDFTPVEDGPDRDLYALQERVIVAQHAMQAGVATMMQYNAAATQPKHLRVGVNTALVDGAAMAKLLIEKGVITQREYLTALAEAMEDEVATYIDLIASATGASVTLT